MDMATLNAQGYALCDPDFYRHYQEHGGEHSGSYEQYRPAYRYGYDLGVHAHYGAGTWLQIDLEARVLWEARNPGTWERFKDPIQYAWERASGTDECVAPPMTQR
jgi:hypothetical protein